MIRSLEYSGYITNRNIRPYDDYTLRLHIQFDRRLIARCIYKWPTTPSWKGLHGTQHEAILIVEFAVLLIWYIYHIDWISFGSFMAKNILVMIFIETMDWSINYISNLLKWLSHVLIASIVIPHFIQTWGFKQRQHKFLSQN